MTIQPMPEDLPEGALYQWKPSTGTLIWHNVVDLAVLPVAILPYWLVAARGDLSLSIDSDFPGDLLPILALFALLGTHEAIHGVVMRSFGASPRFGLNLPWAVYTTAPGHRFRRHQYLTATMAPFVVLTTLGLPACLLPFGGYLVFGFGASVVGCSIDLAISWQVLNAPRGALCEDLQDGVRFWPAIDKARDATE